jgi:hypothetical protein
MHNLTLLKPCANQLTVCSVAVTSNRIARAPQALRSMISALSTGEPWNG